MTAPPRITRIAPGFNQPPRPKYEVPQDQLEPQEPPRVDAVHGHDPDDRREQYRQAS